MSKLIKLKIVTPERIIFEEDVDQVTLPTIEGEITVLPGHVPLVSALKSGEIIARKGDEVIPMAVVGGFIEVRSGEVAVLADFAEHVSELSDEVINKAKARAEELKKMKDNEEVVDFEHFETELERSLTRVRIADKWRNKKYRL
ncbi:MAG: ATP synthase F1 subunit epsilon [Candidatus Paceibacterota bacterium]|jgi:F-type H+-transporting ATPase subunit epsilon